MDVSMVKSSAGCNHILRSGKGYKSHVVVGRGIMKTKLTNRWTEVTLLTHLGVKVANYQFNVMLRTFVV